MKVFTGFLLVLATCCPLHAADDFEARRKALKALCPIGIKAGGIWGDDVINGAIATLGFGSDWPDHAQGTAYKLCNYGGYLD